MTATATEARRPGTPRTLEERDAVENAPGGSGSLTDRRVDKKKTAPAAPTRADAAKGAPRAGVEAEREEREGEVAARWIVPPDATVLMADAATCAGSYATVAAVAGSSGAQARTLVGDAFSSRWSDSVTLTEEPVVALAVFADGRFPHAGKWATRARVVVLLVSVVSAGRGRVLVNEVQQGIEVSSSLVLFGSAILWVN